MLDQVQTSKIYDYSIKRVLFNRDIGLFIQFLIKNFDNNESQLLFLPKQDIFTGKVSKQQTFSLNNLQFMQNPSLYKELTITFDFRFATHMVLAKDLIKLGDI